jgi:uncharacterized membrane protein YfcA
MAGDGFGWGLLIGLGAINGFVSGLLGMGGGVVIIPTLIFAGPLVGIAGPDLPKIAMASSLVLIIPTSIAGLQGHMTRGTVEWGLWAILAPCIMAGSLATSLIVQHLDLTVLLLVFVGNAILSARRLLHPQSAATGAPHADLTLSQIPAMALKSCVGGAFSAALGIGVAFFAVPMLSRFVSLPRAIGTATALVTPMAVTGSAGYLFAPPPEGCVGCTGYVSLPAVAALSIGGILVAPIGAQMTTKLPVVLLQRVFAVMLILGVCSMLAKWLPQLASDLEARFALAGLPALAGPAQTEPAIAPAWLHQPPGDLGFDLARRYGPRPGFARLRMKALPARFAPSRELAPEPPSDASIKPKPAVAPNTQAPSKSPPRRARASDRDRRRSPSDTPSTPSPSAGNGRGGVEASPDLLQTLYGR